MRTLLIKAISFLAMFLAAEYANAYDVSFVGNYVIVKTDFRTYYVDVATELKKNDTVAILKRVCEKVPETCAKN